MKSQVAEPNLIGMRLDSKYRDMRYFRMKPIVFTATGARQWAKLSPDVRRRIDRRLMEFSVRGNGDVKRLKGRDGVRVGDWRVIFYEDQGTIVVAAVGHRREIYD
jgi:mRNA interferase RelE/StbE